MYSYHGAMWLDRLKISNAQLADKLNRTEKTLKALRQVNTKKSPKWVDETLKGRLLLTLSCVAAACLIAHGFYEDAVYQDAQGFDRDKCRSWQSRLSASVIVKNEMRLWSGCYCQTRLTISFETTALSTALVRRGSKPSRPWSEELSWSPGAQAGYTYLCRLF